VLEARWWFYAVCKLTGILHSTTLAFLTSDTVQFDPKRLIGFFDCDHYEQFVYFNLDRLVLNDNYATWKQFLKDFCWQFDGFDHWRVNKTKFHSVQAHIYCEKKLILNDARYIMLLDDGSRVSTHSLPLFSAIEWENNRSYYEYAFRHTDTVSCTVA
jgi:hypothetical protein